MPWFYIHYFGLFALMATMVLLTYFHHMDICMSPYLYFSVFVFIGMWLIKRHLLVYIKITGSWHGGSLASVCCSWRLVERLQPIWLSLIFATPCLEFLAITPIFPLDHNQFTPYTEDGKRQMFIFRVLSRLEHKTHWYLADLLYFSMDIPFNYSRRQVIHSSQTKMDNLITFYNFFD